MIFILLILTTVSCINIFENAEWSTDYISLNPSKKSRVFYYLIESSNNTLDPLLIWIGSGPGCSSANSMFMESAPYVFDGNFEYSKNNYSWNNAANILYLDYPFGTGLSENDYDKDAIKNINIAANDLNTFIIKFFERYQNYRNRKLYFGCESYSCQIVTRYAINIHNKKKQIGGIILRSPMID